MQAHTRHPATALREAFTLIELVAVMIVLAVISASAAPLMRSAMTASTATVARQAAETMLYARELAVQTGVRTWVVFNTTSQTMSVLQENPAAPGRAGAATISEITGSGSLVRRFNQGGNQGITITGVTFTDAGSTYAEIGFDTRARAIVTTGNVLTDADGTVTIAGSGTSWRIRVGARTGHIWTEAVP